MGNTIIAVLVTILFFLIFGPIIAGILTLAATLLLVAFALPVFLILLPWFVIFGITWIFL